MFPTMLVGSPGRKSPEEAMPQLMRSHAQEDYNRRRMLVAFDFLSATCVVERNTMTSMVKTFEENMKRSPIHKNSETPCTLGGGRTSITD